MEPTRTSRARVWQKEWEPMPWDFERRTVYTETEENTHQKLANRQKSKLDAKQMKYKEYQVHYYGSAEEKSLHKSQIRSYLKEQVDLIESPQQKFIQNVEESKKLAEKDKKEQAMQKEQDTKHRDFLTKFRDENKMAPFPCESLSMYVRYMTEVKLIELQAQQRKDQRRAEVNEEKKLLEHNPINWSHSLW